MGKFSREKGKRGETTYCKNCGKPILDERHFSFCSYACYRDFYHKRGNEHKEYQDGDEILYEFTCRTCGKLVRVVDPKDRRTVYCSQQCEKKYWRNVTKRNNGYARRGRGGNIGMSGGMSLGSLIRREKRDLY